MSNKEEYISGLIDKYLDGETSPVEENTLREYFTDKANTIPEAWTPYRALFTYIAEEKSQTLQTTHRVHAPCSSDNDSTRIRSKALLRPKWIYAAMAAAAAILLAVIMTVEPRSSDNYAVINGKVCTDKKVVEEEALKALNMVSTDEEDNFGALEMMRQ